MTGTGTLVNALGIIAGGILGIIGKRLLNDKIQEALMKTSGLCVVFIGIAGAVSKMLTINDGVIDTQGTLMLILSFVFGTITGELLNIEKHFENFGCWLKEKSGSQSDNNFVNAFITASFTVCIGAMAIIGAIQDGMQGDPSILIMKALLDFIIITVMAASMGKGCIFSAVPVVLLQGSITALARLIAPVMTEAALNNISLTGSVLIFCVGVNLIEKNKFSVANMLPTIVFAAIFGMF